MTAQKRKSKASDPAAPTPLVMEAKDGETNREVAARKLVGPFARHGLVTAEAAARVIERMDAADKPGAAEFGKAVLARAEKAKAGELEASSELLMAQAVSLDSIFTEYARIALVNIVGHMDASERYMRLALKAQANSRATLEALAKLHQPREQTVRHVHVNEGGQAVIADQFHNHARGHRNAETAEQPHAAGTSAAGSGTAMLGHDPQGFGLSVPGDQGTGQVPNARGQGQRRAKRQS
jgi:hypothetical protein